MAFGEQNTWHRFRARQSHLFGLLELASKANTNCIPSQSAVMSAMVSSTILAILLLLATETAGESSAGTCGIHSYYDTVDIKVGELPKL